MHYTAHAPASRTAQAIQKIAREPYWSFLLIFAISAAVRCALLPLVPLNPAWPLGWENGATADCLVRTGAYANPYIVPTGPTAHPIPFYTAVMALIYWIFGTTYAAELCRYLLAVVTFSLLYSVLPWVGARLGTGAPAGLMGGLVGALSPLHLPPGGLGEEVAGLVMALLCAAHLARWISRAASLGGSVLIGLVWGAAFHVSPPLLPVMLGCVAFGLWWNWSRTERRHSAVILACAALACAPWTARNALTFDRLFFMRSNLGLELRMGNHAGAEADMEAMDRSEPGRHPRTHREEAEKVRILGEMRYMDQAGREAMEWIALNPGRFAELTLLRAVHFWFGSLHQAASVLGTTLLTVLALLGALRILPKLVLPQRAALLIPLATYPLIYYLVAHMPRYRVPVDWILLLLAGAEIWHWTSGSGRSRAGSAAGTE